MLAADIPRLLPVPWAQSGLKNLIPIPSQQGITDGAASYTDGFPPKNLAPIASGGVPPFGQDFNGVFNDLTQWARWVGAGGPAFFNASFAASIGGYPKGAELRHTTQPAFSWINTIDANTSDPEGGSPVGWYLSPNRLRLTADLTLKVATTGNDATGLGTVGAPWATRQKAWNYIVGTLDLNGFNVFVDVANGTYTDSLIAFGIVLGLGTGNGVFFRGSTASPASCVISTTNANCFQIGNGAVINISGFSMTAAGAVGATPAGCVVVTNASGLRLAGSCNFGAAAGAHMWAQSGATIDNGGNTSYTISGGAAEHLLANPFGTFVFGGGSGFTVTLTGTPNFSNAFAFSTEGYLQFYGGTFTGAATGKKFNANSGGIIQTAGSGTNYFPGDVAGTQTYNGLYF
jgi:hypothetical protein